jgi:hypothetical protein
MTAIALLAAFATILGAGFGALTLFARVQTRQNLAEQLALSWLCGTGIVSFLIWTLGFVVHGVLLFALVAVVCVTLPFASWKMNGRSTFRVQPLKELRTVELLLGTLLIVQIGIIFYVARLHTLGWDGLMNWEIKARYAFENGGVLPAAYFRNHSLSFSHSSHPLAIPFSELWLYFWLGEPNQFWVKTIFALFYAAGATLLAAISARLTGKTSPGLIAATLLLFIPQIAFDGESVTAGYADFPLSVFYLATVGYLLCACRSNDPNLFRIYAACLALLPWVKREALVLWLVAASSGVFVIWRRKKSPAHLLALLPGLFVLIVWHFYLWKVDVVSPSEFLPVSVANLLSNVHRLGPIVSAFLNEFAQTGPWSLFWLLIAIGSVYFVQQYRDIRSIVFFFALFAPIAVYPFIFIFSNWPNYLAQVALCSSRMLTDIVPLSCLAIAVALASDSQQPIGLRNGELRATREPALPKSTS